MTVNLSPSPPLTKRTTIGYGIGELSKEMPNSILVFFLLYFLNNVAGLSPGRAGLIILVGKCWDALNDPLIGWLSDRTQSKWGRRFPWMLAGAVPLGLSFWMLWLTPKTEAPWQQFLYYCVALILFYTGQTAVAIPHATLGAELTQTYDERTRLISVKSAFSIGSSILGLIIAQVIFSLGLSAGLKYSVLGGVIGIIAIFAALICVWATYARYWQMQSVRSTVQAVPHISLGQQFKTALSLRPFLAVMGIYLCSWVGLQMTAGILQYFVMDYMGLAESHFTQMILAVQGTALIMMFFWRGLAQRYEKRTIYCWGIPLTLVAQVGLFLLQPNQLGMMYACGVLAGLGLSTAYLIPWAMLPDVIDLDELKSGQRREGIFCGVFVQLQKFGTALTIFILGQVLELAGYVTHAEQQSATLPQSESAIAAIRYLVGPVPAVVLVIGIAIALSYSITRDRHQQILLQLQERKTSS